MAPARKRETRETQFYNVGEQGRKTGIRLEDKGVRDEYGMEPISGIFSSPEKSPPKRAFRSNGTLTGSESMDIDSSGPDFAPGHALRHNRPNLPPPKGRSPMKTSLGSSPRRQSSMGPRLRSAHETSSPDRASSHPAVNRLLDFDQTESDLQETPALSGSGTRRGKMRPDIYDLERSPSRATSVALDKSLAQGEMMPIDGADDGADLVNDYMDESFAGVAGEDSLPGAEEADEVDFIAEVEESEVMEVVEETAKQPAKRGKKRKSNALDILDEEETPAPRQNKKSVATEQSSNSRKTKTTKTTRALAAEPVAKRGKPNRTSEVFEEEPSIVTDASADDFVPERTTKPRGKAGRPRRISVATEEEPSAAVDTSFDEPPTKTKRRPGRPKRISEATEGEPSTIAGASANDSSQVEEARPEVPRRRPGRPPKSEAEKASAHAKKKSQPAEFRKPAPISKVLGKSGSKSKWSDKENGPIDPDAPGRLVDTLGKPLSKEEIDDRVSATSTASRYGRGRSLSVFRALTASQASERVGRTGRRHLPPVNFWLNEQAQYDRDGNLQSVLRNETPQNPPKKSYGGRPRGRKRALDVIDEDEEELEEWEESEGVLIGGYRDYDRATGLATNEVFEEAIAWAQKGIQPAQVPDAEFKFTKLGPVDRGAYFSFGYIALDKDGQKRMKNSRRMHMVFHVTKGAVEVKVHEDQFIVHSGGLWQVPRGNTYSIRNVANAESLVFFAQAQEPVYADD